MPSRYEPSQDMPIYRQDRSQVARQTQNFDAIFEDRTLAVSRAKRRAMIQRCCLRFTVIAVVAAIAFVLGAAAWSKTQNTLALYYQIQQGQAVG